MSNLNWGIVGTGWIGSEMAEALWAVDGTVMECVEVRLRRLKILPKNIK